MLGTGVYRRRRIRRNDIKTPSRRFGDARQAISHLQLGDQVTWARGLVFELLPQVSHVDAYVVRARGIPRPPNFYQ